MPKPEMHYRNQQFEDFYNGWERENYHQQPRRCSPRLLGKNISRRRHLFLARLVAGSSRAAVRIARSQNAPAAGSSRSSDWPASSSSSGPHAHYAAPITCVLYLLVVQTIRHLRTMRIGTRPVGLALSRAIRSVFDFWRGSQRRSACLRSALLGLRRRSQPRSHCQQIRVTRQANI